MKTSIFIGTSIDGYIADKDGGIGWLETVPNPEGQDFGYADFMKNIDALIMGRITFETVCGFDIDWPYDLPVFVLSTTMDEIPEGYRDKVELAKGSLRDIMGELAKQGYDSIYVDGGQTIQRFLKEGIIDEMIITRVPILLGGGVRLFADLPDSMAFELLQTKVFLEQIVQSHYQRRTI